MREDTVKVYVQLLEEGVDTARPTKAVPLESGKFKLLPTEDYDPEDEVWEFLPYSIVRTVSTTDDKGNNILLAVSSKRA
jgi:hypothetical protein